MAPTVGRIVWYWAGYLKQEQPMAALIARVNEDGSLNLGVFDPMGFAVGRMGVPLVLDGQDKPTTGPWCQWPVLQAADQVSARDQAQMTVSSAT